MLEAPAPLGKASSSAPVKFGGGVYRPHRLNQPPSFYHGKVNEFGV